MIFKDKGILKALWAGMFILCALLGFVPQQEGANKYLLLVMGVLFFLPPALLIYFAKEQGDTLTLKLIRNLSIASLVLTVVLILANFLSLMAPEAVGNILYGVLVIVSSPMVCSGYWVLSLFCWACLLMASLRCLNKR